MTETPELKDRVQDALDEARTLILGTQVLLGFQFQAAFEPGFERRLGDQKVLSLLSMVLLLANFIALVLPITRNLLVDRGIDTAREYRFTTSCVAVALPLFAVALGINLELVVAPTGGVPLGTTIGAMIALTALALWFGVRPRTNKEGNMLTDEVEDIALKEKIRQVLTETRVVLPGAQALLGFSAITTLLDSFADLPPFARLVHLGSLVAVTLSTVLLMTPAAIHRIAEHGQASERFHRLAGLQVLAALMALSVALSAEVFVVFVKVTDSSVLSLSAASLCLIGSIGVWFIVPVILRAKAADRR